MSSDSTSSEASSGASREANSKQRKNSTNHGSKSSSGTDKSKPHDDVLQHMNSSLVSTVKLPPKEQYQQFKSENGMLRNKTDELGDEIESAKARARVNSQTVAETKELMSGKDKELNRLQKCLEKAQSDQEGTAEQLKALQKKYTQLNQDKERVEAEKVTLDQLHKAKIADLEQKLSESSEELSHFHKQLQEAEDDDITLASCDELTQGIKNEEKKAMNAFQTVIDKLTMEFRQATETALMASCDELTQGIKNEEKKAMNAFQSQSLEMTNKIDVLTDELTTERSALENAKKLVEDYENRLTAQEETISQLNSVIKQNDENTTTKITTLQNEKEALLQANQNMSEEVARLMSVDSDLHNRENEIEKYKLELCKAEEEIEAKESMLNTYKEDCETERNNRKTCESQLLQAEEKLQTMTAEINNLKDQLQQLEIDKKAQEHRMKILQARLEKALDPLENIEELKEVVDLKEEIGRGAYGIIKEVSVHGTICAAKEIHELLINYASYVEFERIQKTFLEECVKCSKLFHPNIVQFLGIHYPSKQAKLPWLVMELLDCSLTGFVKKYDKENVSLFVKSSIFCDISLGLQFLHGRNIIHRDLSSNNVLLTKHLTAKIADLGVAKVIDPDGSKSFSVAPGTQHFLPPDVFSDSDKLHYGKPIDVFSLGCIMIHVTTHKWPAPLPATQYNPELRGKVAFSEVDRRKAYLDQIQELPELKVLIENCLDDGPKMRPDITKMVNDLGKLRLTYQKNSNLAGNEMNAVEFEKSLKSQDKTIEKLNATIQDANKLLQVACFVCQKCKRQFKEGQLSDYKLHIDNCHK